MNIAYLLLIVAFISVLLIFTNLGSTVRGLYSWFTNVMHLRSLPSPPRTWLLGHALKIDESQNTLSYMQENHKNFPKMCVYWLGALLPWVYVADVEAAKVFLHQPGEAPRPHVYGYLEKCIGDGLGTISGAKWAYYRRLLVGIFHFDILKQYLPIYNEISHKLTDVWSSFADSGKSIDITKYNKQFSMDIQFRCLYSKDGGCLDNKENSYMGTVDEIFEIVQQRIYKPHYAFDWIFFSTATGRKFLRCCDVIHEQSYDVIRKRRMEIAQGGRKSRKFRDFIDILLSIKDENGKGLTDKEVREQVDNFMIGGHDTTALGLTWSLYCLAKNKKHQEICRKEVRTILAGRDSDEILWEDLSKLNYTTMCIKEAIRIYPVVPIIAKLSSEDVVVNGYKVPKGTWIGIGMYTIHHDPLVWDDPEKFDPMRFDPENSKNMDTFSYLTFSAGSRNCLGQRFALHQLKVAIATILNKFHLETDASHKVEPCVAGMLKPKNGIKLKFYTAA